MVLEKRTTMVPPLDTVSSCEKRTSDGWFRKHPRASLVLLLAAPFAFAWVLLPLFVNEFALRVSPGGTYTVTIDDAGFVQRYYHGIEAPPWLRVLAVTTRKVPRHSLTEVKFIVTTDAPVQDKATVMARSSDGKTRSFRLKVLPPNVSVLDRVIRYHQSTKSGGYRK